MMNDEKLDKMKLDYFNNQKKCSFHSESSALIFFSLSILTLIIVSTSNVSQRQNYCHSWYNPNGLSIL